MSKTDSLRISNYLGHIVEAIERIYRYIEDCSEMDFLHDEKTQDAVIPNFEIIGEAARNIECRHSNIHIDLLGFKNLAGLSHLHRSNRSRAGKKCAWYAVTSGQFTEH